MHNGFGFIKEHELYLSLGKDTLSSQNAYLEIFKTDLSPEMMALIRTGWRQGTPLGNSYFREKVEKHLQGKANSDLTVKPFSKSINSIGSSR